MKRLKLLVELVTAAGTCRGGSLASCIYAFINHGETKKNIKFYNNFIVYISLMLG